jgi:CelD/BcsL family acetyltransferase involved in cellulose biosynthesis
MLSDPDLLRSAGLDAYDFDHLPSQLGRGTVSTVTDHGSPQMDLSDGYDSCVASKGESWKRGQRDMARKLRKMERELGPVRLEFSTASNDLFDLHAAMRNDLYRRMGLREDYCTGWKGEVLRSLRRTEGPDFRSVLSVLFAGGQPVAAHFGLTSFGTLHWWFPAYDLAVQGYSPGLQLIDHCARQAAAEGISTIDFGKGDDRYKRLFGDSCIALLSGSLCREGTYAAMTRSCSARMLALAERVLPSPMKSLPKRSVERLWTGTSLPRQV